MSPIEQKINNSYESEPSSGTSNGSSIDTLTMGNHDLDQSPPKLSALLGLSGRDHSATAALHLHNHHHHGHRRHPVLGTPRTPRLDEADDNDDDDDLEEVATSDEAKRRLAISEAADRERVELAKIYFQRVFAEQQQLQQCNAEREIRTPVTKGSRFAGAASGGGSNSFSNDAHVAQTQKESQLQRLLPTAGGALIPSCSSSSDKSSSSGTGSHDSRSHDSRSSSNRTPCFSAEISDQDEKCRRELLQQQQLGQIIGLPAAERVDDNDDDDDEGDNDDDEEDDDDDEDVSNVSVYSIEPSSSHDTITTNTTNNTLAPQSTQSTPAKPEAIAVAATTASFQMAAPLARHAQSTVPHAFVADNSCNAVDNRLSNGAGVGVSVGGGVVSLATRAVSFDGCFPTQTRPTTSATTLAEQLMPRKTLSAVLQAERNCMQANNELSPDLFEESDGGDDDDDDDEEDEEEEDEEEAEEEEEEDVEEGREVQLEVDEQPDVVASATKVDISALPQQVKVDDKRAHIHASEKVILGRIQTSLSGLLPPPSVTILQYDMLEMLSMYKQNSARLLATATANELAGCGSSSSSTAFPSLSCVNGRSEFRPTHSTTELAQLQWPDCQDAKAHGLHYNRSECTESIEMLCMRYAERNIGAETASTFTTNMPSSCKKRTMRLKQLTKSPGNRLSHLARRRAVFSSANLLNKSTDAAAATAKLGQNQLCIDTRNRDRRSRANASRVRTPKRRTPGRRTPGRRTPGRRTPGRKTPGSSRKRLQFGNAASTSAAVGCSTAAAPPVLPTLKPLVPATRETSKRQLFQSPPQERPRPQFPADVAHRVERSKRVLFSPLPPSHRNAQSGSVPQTPEDPQPTSSIRASAALLVGGSALRKQLSFGATAAICENSYGATNGSSIPFQAPPKRKREEDAATPGSLLAAHTAKMPRLASAATINLDNLTPRTAKLVKSQSFSVNAATPSGSLYRGAAGSLQRATSEQTFGSAGAPLLSDLHKKKIFWATATALKNKKIGSQHASYKQYASVLAKVIKRFYLELPERKGEGTSAAMLKIAEKHVFWVLQGRNEDEIYLNEKQRVDQTGVKLSKVSGYVAPEEYELRKSLLMRSRSSCSTLSTLSSSFCGESGGGGSGVGGSGFSAFGSQLSQQSLQLQQHHRQTSVSSLALSQESVTASQIADSFAGAGSGGQSLTQVAAAAAALAAANSTAAPFDISALCTDHRMQLSASKSASKRRPADHNGNSTSKSNTKTGVLRENDQRQKSAQKASFSGRDQKNVSPFGTHSRLASVTKGMASSAACGSSLSTAAAGVSANIMKAKRQISFDS